MGHKAADAFRTQTKTIIIEKLVLRSFQ